MPMIFLSAPSDGRMCVAATETTGKDQEVMQGKFVTNEGFNRGIKFRHTYVLKPLAGQTISGHGVDRARQFVIF